ncbi:MAG: hypothetical protein M3O36_06815 [Myxococcota bacterium]|nr:hypothetical protein [Myxococcota bacterium]
MTLSRVRRAIAALALCAGCARSGGAAGLDAVPESRDVRVQGGLSPGESATGYAYVARRPLAVVALAESRGVRPEVARTAVDRVADALDACATEMGRKGSLPDGAARVLAQVDPDGSVGATSVHIDPGPGVARSAVMCFVAPVRLLSFPPSSAGARALAIEAMWGRLVPRR